MARICAVTNGNIQDSDLMAICTLYPALKTQKQATEGNLRKEKVTDTRAYFALTIASPNQVLTHAARGCIAATSGGRAMLCNRAQRA